MVGKLQGSSLPILILLFLIFPVFLKAAPRKTKDVEYELVGDMLLPKKSVLTPLSGVLDPQRRWPNAVVPYEISSDFSSEEQQVILDAMAEIGGKTCVQFIPRVFEKDYVQVVPDTTNACFSNVGRTGEVQIVNLGQGCVDIGTAMHELIHSLGFYHEQARADRDQYVEIIWKNIEEDKKNQFQIIREGQVDFNVGYDYGSIMHYGRYDFSKYRGQEETIRPKTNSNVEIGQRTRLSPKDILKIRRMYKIADYGRCFSLRGPTTTRRRTTTTTEPNSPWFSPRPYFPSNPNGNQWPVPWQPVPIQIPGPRQTPGRPSWIPSWFPWW